MLNKFLTILIAALLICLTFQATALAGESKTVQGTIEVGVRTVDDAEESALYQEFRALDTPVFGSIHLRANKPDGYVQFDAEAAGSDDMTFLLQGNRYGFYKYRVHYSEMEHNYYFDAITPASGMGTDFVSYPLLGSVADLDEWWRDWHSFDYSVTHRSLGAEVGISLNSPFFLNLAIERQKDDGLRPYSTRYFTELGEPVSAITDNASATFGYAKDDISASLTGSVSQFKNDHPFMRWSAPDDGDIAEIVFSPDSEMTRLAGDLRWRNLPLRSVLAASASRYWLESDFTGDDVGYDFTEFTNYNRDNFEGDITYTTFSLSLLSRPLPKLSTKLYYRYIERDNESSIISYERRGSLVSNADELLSYDKDVLGFNVRYRLPARNQLKFGYEYTDIDRSTPSGDAIPTNGTEDNEIFVQWKNSTLDWMTTKLRYTYMDRESSAIGREISSSTPTSFYYMDQSSDQVKLAFEFYPLDALDLGLDLNYKEIDYDHAIDTRQEEEHQSIYLDANWRATDKLSLNGFVGFEMIDTEANRVDNNEATAQRRETVKEDFWTYGLGLDYQASEKLRFDLTWQYQESDGEVEITSLNPAESEFLPDSDWVDIDKSDDYTRNQFEAKAVYSLTDAIKLTLAYIYEKLDYSDRNYSNYPYNYLVDDGDDGILSGLYSDQDYEIHAAYLTMSYSF